MENGQGQQPLGNGHQRTLPPPGNSDEGRLRAVEQDVREIKTEIKHLATKEDIADLRTLVATREASLQRWLIGILISAVGTTVIALIKLFS